jgi:hypothetical protein
MSHQSRDSSTGRRSATDISFDGHWPSGALAEAAQLFAGLRRVLNLTLEGAADIIGTEPNVVSALETGMIGALPPWPETRRLVEAYTGLAGCEAEPVLTILKMEFDRLEADRSASIPPGYSSPPGAAPPAYDDPVTDMPADMPAFPAVLPGDEPAPPAINGEIEPASPRWRKGRGGRPVPVGAQLASFEGDARPQTQYTVKLPSLTRTLARALSTAVASRGVRLGLIGCGLAMALLLALCQPRLVHFVSSRLPDPMARNLRSVHDYLLIRFAPEREGLRWIEVSDPRVRRSDKLHNVGQFD